ncbi:MAG: MmgE/PrpD family protein, partial [Betaproteobacteria bacterium]|nr:MmgE/PrpD family protein [Betaproteobacteria bacterium]
ALDEELGRTFAITATWIKVYPCCGLIHSTAHALEALKREHRLSAAQVKQIRVRTSRRAVVQNGDPDPREPMAAQYSIPFCAGVALAKDPRDPGAYAEQNLHDPVVRELAARTALEVDPEMERQYPAHFGARVEVTLGSGKAVHLTILDPHGTPADPCSPQEAEAKFRRLASSVKRTDTVERILAAVRSLAPAPTLEAFSRALREGDGEAEEPGVPAAERRVGAA